MGEPTWTDVAQVVLVGLQLVLLGIAAFVATRQVREARRLREDQARPFIVADFDVRDHLIFLTVSNVGTSLAREVRFDIEPELRSTIEEVPPGDLKMFREGIPTLAPGKEMRTLFDTFIQREQVGLEDEYRFVIRYSDDRENREFEEELVLDIGLYRNVLTVARHGVHHVDKTLDKILKEIKKWRAGSRGLLTLSPEERRAEAERERQQIEEARHQRSEHSGQ